MIGRVILAACTLAGCADVGALPPPPPLDVVTWHLSTIDVERYDITPPTRLDVVIDVEDVDAATWCAGSGGTLHVATCRDVDY
jgi:hypothetical protein